MIILFQKQIERQSYQKISDATFFAKKTRQRTLCIFFKRNLYATKSEEIFVPESVQRNLYQKMFEKKILTKSLQEISPAKKLRREISSKESLKNKSTESLKRNLYKTTLQRHLQHFSQERCLPNKHLRVFFSEYYTERISGDFLPNYIPVKDLPKNSPEIVTAKYLKMSTQRKIQKKALKKSFYKNF